MQKLFDFFNYVVNFFKPSHFVELEKITQQLPGVVYQFRLNLDGTSCFPYASEAIRDIYRVTPQEVQQSAEKVFALLYFDDFERISCSISESAKNLTPWAEEYRIKFDDGTIRWLYGNALPQREFDGSTLWHGFITDITQRKEIDLALKASEERLNVCQEYGGIGSWEADLPNGTQIWSKAIYQLVDLPILENPTFDDFLSIIHPDDRERILEATQRHLLTKEKYEVEYRTIRRDGTIRWLCSAGRAEFTEYGIPSRFRGIAYDITERKLIEQSLLENEVRLKESEFRWKFALDGSGDGMWDWNIQNNSTFFSKRWKEMIGYSEDEFENTFFAWEKCIHPDDKANVLTTVQNYLAEKTPIYVCEHRLQTKDGCYKWILARGMIVSRDETGKPLRMIGTHTDISNSKENEQKLRRSEGFISSVLDSLTSHIAVLDNQGIIVSVNKAWKQFGEYNSLPKINNHLLGSNYLNVCNCIDETNDKEIKTIHSGILDVLNGKQDYFSCEYPCHSESEKRWFLMNVSPLQDENGGVVISHENITNRKKIEQELQRSNAELEQFAYAVSHDMRQPLRMVTSYLSLIESALQNTLDDDTRLFLHFATDGAKRMDNMILSLLDYSRVGRCSEPLSYISSKKCLEEAVLFLKPDLESNNGNIEITGDWIDLIASRDELTRLLQNLIGNALKYHNENQPPVIHVCASVKASIFRVEVCDNGIGIEPEQINRLFKVFSRLQARSRFEGTGVGLALCRKIIEHHGGKIGVNSDGDGLGCVFWFELPVISNKLIN